MIQFNCHITPKGQSDHVIKSVIKANVCVIYGYMFFTSSRPLLNLFGYIIYPGKILDENRTYEKQNLRLITYITCTYLYLKLLEWKLHITDKGCDNFNL